ncbi:MAG TPA: NAD(P)H-hydrate epimerase [Candidatus Limnocylindrales bacterium]|jgi:ADP-dependent NAD(P)H-hydrate dehydratase / NAD(P)H-hydrate epimerase
MPPLPASSVSSASAGEVLPADDPELMELSLRELRGHWATAAERPPMTAEAMRGADRRAQAFGIAGERLMEHAGAAVAAAARALAIDTERWGRGPIVILCGPGNNGGDGLVAARHLAAAGAKVIVGLVAPDARPSTADAGRNWDRLLRDKRITVVHAGVARDVAMFGHGIDKAAVIVDALLGTGVHGPLREPIRSAVELINSARGALVPVLAVDTPTAVDLTSGDPSDPAVRADLTITFHRPKTGLLTRNGKALAGRMLVAPIGIPAVADPG